MTTESIPEPPRRPSAAWRLAVALVAVLAATAAWNVLGRSASRTLEASGTSVSAEAVTVTVSGGGLEPAPQGIAWRDGMTVRDATDGGFSAVWRGDGSMAFLESLGGVPNQGADGLNWQFEVNDEYADRGAGDYPLAPGDRVLWKLAPYE